MIIEMQHLILIYVGQHRELIFVINCSYIYFTYFTLIITWTIDDWQWPLLQKIMAIIS